MSGFTRFQEWFSKNVFGLVLERRTTHGQQTSSLDGLRGVAALLVVVDHVSGQGVVLAPFLDAHKTGIGRSGVYLFFVLSSFLLTGQFLRLQLDFKNVRVWLGYFQRRLLRIYPLYIVVMLVYLFVPGFKYDLSEVVRHLTLQDGFNQFWAIPVEMKSYLILPILALLFVKVARRDLFLSTFICAVLISANEMYQAIFPPEVPPHSPVISLLPYLPIFVTGSLTALINAEFLNIPTLNQKNKLILEAAALVSILIIWCTYDTEIGKTIWRLLSDNEMPDNQKLYILYGCLWSSFLFCHLHGLGLTKKILSHFILRYIGVISFSIYLWHMAIIGYLDTHLNTTSPIKFIIILLVIITVSTASYILIERPFIRLQPLKKM
jgi:peptidoglycan/LPS O-acetylase OafA/YrhL